MVESGIGSVAAPDFTPSGVAKRVSPGRSLSIFLVALVVSFVALVPRVGHADAPPVVDVTVLTPPVSPPLGQTDISLEPPPDLSALVGKPITFASVEVEDDLWEDTKAPVLSKVRVGDVFTPAVARTALLEAMDSGLFGWARVSAAPDGGGVRVVVHAVPRKVAESISIDLHGAPVERDELLREAMLEEGAELVGSDLRIRKRRIEALLARRGWPDAEVHVTTRQTDKATRVIVLLDITVHKPRELGRRVFYPFGATQEALQVYLNDYAPGRGDRADEPAIETADAALAARLHTAGWSDARVTHDVVLSSKVVTLRVRIDTGSLIVPRFEGNVHYDVDALGTALGLEGDPDHSPLHLADKLRKFYEARGFLDARITPELRGQPKDPERFLILHVAEGPRISATSRTYPCLHEEAIKDLKGGGPRTVSAIGREIDSFLEEELPGADLVLNPDPRGVDALLTGGGTGGARRIPIDLDPNLVYSPETYAHAVDHVQELYRNEGFLGALVGPVQVLRRRCDPRSLPGQCTPQDFVTPPPDVCTYDPNGAPLATKPIDPSYTCVPDPDHGVRCEDHVAIRIPVKLGPRTFLHDLAFTGAISIEETKLAEAAKIELGGPANEVKLEEAKRRIIDAYKEEGFYYVDVRTSLERSLDATKARVRFDINEGERVIVTQIVIRGNRITDEAVIRRRVALVVGRPFKTSDAQKTLERIATLNVFSSVNVSLQNASVPEKNKVVIVNVIESTPQYVELRPGFSTGEGVRAAFEYGHKNLFGSATSLGLRAQMSYLPDLLITDATIRENFGKLSLSQRLAARITVSLGLPNVGLGPLVRASVDAAFLREVNRYFTISKGTVVPSLYYRPQRQLLFTLSATAEINNLSVFGNLTAAQAGAASNNLDVQRLLRVPDGQSFVAAQRVTMAWDRRDSSFNAHSGTYLLLGVEHVNAVPIGVDISADHPIGHFLKLSQTFSGYIPITSKIGLALTMRLGEIVQLTPDSVTYPDRFFFMGGFDSIRSFQTESMIPQDAVDQIEKTSGLADNDPLKIKPENIAVRGGNLLVNPRAELRIPIIGPIETVLFVDTGNLWTSFRYPFENGIAVRVAAGTGIRIQTPVGPLALDYGFNLTKKSYEDIGALNFAIGLF